MENQNQQMENAAFGWDAPISEDGNAEFLLLPKGEYPFTVTVMDREWYEGGEKMPACWKAVLSIAIDGGELGTAFVKENLFLVRKTEWKIGQLFVSIGQKQKGQEGFVPNWDALAGSQGRLKLTQRTYKNKDGEDVVTNDIKAFLEPAEVATPVAPVIAQQQVAPATFQQQPVAVPQQAPAVMQQAFDPARGF